MLRSKRGALAPLWRLGACSAVQKPRAWCCERCQPRPWALSGLEMKITGIEALHLRMPQVELKADGTQEVLLVRVTTDEGIVGHGEAVSNAAVVRAIVEAPRSAPFRHGLAVVLSGSDPLDPEARWKDMYDATRWYGRRGVAIHAMAAVDTALWDIVGKNQHRSCHAV